MTLNGLDVSQYQSVTPSLAGMSFIFARATYDIHPDSMFPRHMSAARNAKIVMGAYHFATGRSTAAAQAAAFLSAAGDADLLAVDFEQDSVPASPALVAAIITAVKAKDPQKRKVGLYHSESGFPELGQDFDWVAHWGVAAPSRHWQFHQYTSDGQVAGYSGRVDLDRFNGDAAALAVLAGTASAGPIVTGTPEYRVEFTGRVLTYSDPGARTAVSAISDYAYTCHRSRSGGLWWYHIVGPDHSDHLGEWFKPTRYTKVTAL